MPARPRKPNEIARQVMPLLLLGVGLVASNNYFTVIDDETWILDAATHPVRTTLALFLSGAGQHQHPPLYDLVLHFWLRWTGGNFEYLRIPAILFYLAGLFLLGRAARRFGGPSSASAVIWLGALWPFGFHYGRLAAWYSFSFFLVAGLTLAYLRYLEDQSQSRWAAFFLFGVALLWTNYFGWALLACLAADQFLRDRVGESTVSPRVMAGTAALFIVSFIPLFRAFYNELGIGIHLHNSVASVIANAAFNVYSLFVSESVAPWHWILSVPAGLAAVTCVALVLLNETRPPRRFLLYSGFLIAVMAVTGILLTKRLLLVAPWVLMPIGIGVATITSRWRRMGLALSLLIFAGIGWYGIRARTYYSAPRFLEPWVQVAGDAADKIHGGATIIANNPSFFFYLTYILRAPGGGADWKFAGVLPDSVHYPNVMSADQWLAAGHPFAPTVLWIRGMDGPQPGGSMDDAAHELDQACGARTSRLTMRDQGFEWKKRFAPELGELQWRIEIREYDCGPATSPEIFPIPAR
jgi:Dolichyl-phosphate-mannose-protein mannosyltransferase